MTHLEDEELLVLMDDASTAPHLDSCTDCSDRLRSFAELRDAIRATPPGTADRLGDLVAEASRRQEEDEEAARLAGPIGTTSITVFRDSPPTGGLARRCVAEARERYDSDPRGALDYLEAAEAMLPFISDAAEHEALIEREKANAWRKLGAFDRSLEALDRASAAVAKLPAPGYEETLIAWNRASTLYVMTRYAEAAAIAREAERGFLSYGDTSKADQVRMLRAAILCDQGNLDRAVRMYERLARRFTDQEMVARIYANLAECEVRRDAPERARAYARLAMQGYEGLGRDSERVRVEWTLGYSLLRQGHADDALEHLRRVAAWFESRGMVADAAEATLDIIELHIVLGEWQEASTLATRTAAQLSSSPIPLARAYAYLREAVNAQSATVELVSWLREWSSTGDQPFAPPA